MSLLMKIALDAELPSAYSIEEEVEALCHYTTGASRGTIEVSLEEGDRSIDKARSAVSSVARKHGATIVSERKLDDAVTFKLSKPIAQDAEQFKEGDVVRVVGNGLASKGWKGSVIRITNNKTWPYVVHFGNGRSDGEYSAAELEKA